MDGEREGYRWRHVEGGGELNDFRAGPGAAMGDS